jgi:hypothetical protein
VANEDKQPITRAEFNQASLKLIDGFKEELKGLDARMQKAFGELPIPGLVELNKRLDEIENSATAPGDKGAAPSMSSTAAKTRRKKGEAVVPTGTLVMFRPHDGGPDEGFAAIVAASRFMRAGFPAVYCLWVLEPRKQRWEENVREGEQYGEFRVQP